MTLVKATVIESARTEQELLDAAVRGLVPSRADWASIHVVKAEGDLQLRAVAHADPYMVNLAWYCCVPMRSAARVKGSSLRPGRAGLAARPTSRLTRGAQCGPSGAREAAAQLVHVDRLQQVLVDPRGL
jgi:hypothetical protein